MIDVFASMLWLCVMLLAADMPTKVRAAKVTAAVTATRTSPSSATTSATTTTTDNVILTDDNLNDAVAEWFAQSDLATAKYGHIRDWDTSRITDMHGLFQGRTDFNENIGHWNTMRVTNLSYLFNKASSFNQDLSAWDTRNVQYMDGIFNFATSFNGDIGSWSTQSVQSMDYAFGHATSFNVDISGWNTASLTYAAYSFRSATSFSQDLTSWNVSQLQDVAGMFHDASAFDHTLCWDLPETTLSRATNLFCGSQGALDVNCVSSLTVLKQMDNECPGDNDDIGNKNMSTGVNGVGGGDHNNIWGVPTTGDEQSNANNEDLIFPTHTTSPDNITSSAATSSSNESYDRLQYAAISIASASLALIIILCIFVLWQRQGMKQQDGNNDEATVTAEDDEMDGAVVKESNTEERIRVEGTLHVC